MKIVYIVMGLAVSFLISASAFARETCHAECLVLQTGFVTSLHLAILYNGNPPGDSILIQDLGQVKGDTLEDLTKSCQVLIEKKGIIYLLSETATARLVQDFRLDSTHGLSVVSGLSEKTSCP